MNALEDMLARDDVDFLRKSFSGDWDFGVARCTGTSREKVGSERL